MRKSRKKIDSRIDEAGWVYQPENGGRWLTGHMKAWCKQKRAMDLAEWEATKNAKLYRAHQRWVNYIKMVQATSLTDYLYTTKEGKWDVCQMEPQYQNMKRLLGVPLIIEEC